MTGCENRSTMQLMVAVEIRRLLEEVRHPGAMFGGFKREDGCSYPHISEVLKPNTRRHYRYPERYDGKSRLNEDRMTPRGVWHYRRIMAILRVMEKIELEG